MTRQTELNAGQKKSVVLSIRTTPEIKEWITENGYSASGIFQKTIEEIIIGAKDK